MWVHVCMYSRVVRVVGGVLEGGVFFISFGINMAWCHGISLGSRRRFQTKDTQPRYGTEYTNAAGSCLLLFFSFSIR